MEGRQSPSPVGLGLIVYRRTRGMSRKYLRRHTDTGRGQASILRPRASISTPACASLCAGRRAGRAPRTVRSIPVAVDAGHTPAAARLSGEFHARAGRHPPAVSIPV
ncbi:unnamed protein product [Mycena citricolor]|uniref:Uncharacterized protein n=1 Tax=Mycena citricolor TaxID=2018698 RepID=A0AAD2HXG5_9AGAR|nr:unnamed protein product [Mycena citricolor]